jgi:hypothetical protein
MSHLIESIPAIVRILLSFVLILAAIKRKWMLGNAFVLGAVALGVLFSMPPVMVARSVIAALANPKTFSLTVVVALILVLSHSLERSGQMARLLESFQGLIPWPRINLVVFPALIGLLPMPGGAVFSAPMVKRIGQVHKLSGSQLSYVNYWFRHIWEYWWPLYPGVLLATALAGVNLWRLVLFTLPLTAVVVLSGYWPIRKVFATGASSGSATPSFKQVIGPFSRELAPIAWVIAGGLGLGLAASGRLPSALGQVEKELGLISALLVAICWVWRRNALAWHQRKAIVVQPVLVKMIYMVSAILMFKGVLEDSGAVELVSQEMLRWHIPLMPISMALPFLVGAVAGITIAFVGATFPILISLINTLQQSDLMLPYMMLAMASGFAGVLLSPLHLCLLLSNEYFETSLAPVYLKMQVPVMVLLVSSAGYFGLLSLYMG